MNFIGFPLVSASEVLLLLYTFPDETRWAGSNLRQCAKFPCRPSWRFRLQQFLSHPSPKYNFSVIGKKHGRRRRKEVREWEVIQEEKVPLNLNCSEITRWLCSVHFLGLGSSFTAHPASPTNPRFLLPAPPVPSWQLSRLPFSIVIPERLSVKAFCTLQCAAFPIMCRRSDKPAC